MSAAKLKTYFLSQTKPILDQMIIDATTFDPEAPDKQAYAKAELWVMLKDIIVNAKDVAAMNVQNTADVLALLNQGSVTPNEALQLMQAMQARAEVDKLPELIEKLEGFQ